MKIENKKITDQLITITLTAQEAYHITYDLSNCKDVTPKVCMNLWDFKIALENQIDFDLLNNKLNNK